MHRVLVVVLAFVSGCSRVPVDVGAQQDALKDSKSCPPLACKPKADYPSRVKAECCLHGAATIGPNGGSVTTGDGTTVAVPLGAVDADTTITITASDTPAPKGAVSPVISFGPDGLVFAHPVTVTIPLASAAGKLTTFWTKHDGSGQFEPIGGTVVGGNMVVAVTHFSSGYVAADAGTRDINGIEKVTWVAPNYIDNRPTDLTALPVEALVADGSGGYTSYPGVGAADGTFTIAGVPAGDAIIHAGSMYTELDVTNTTSIDLGSSQQGRYDQTPADPASSFLFNVGGMTPWQDTDRIEFFCSNNLWMFDLQDIGLAGFPAAGDMSLSNVSIPETEVQSQIGIPGNLIVANDGSHPGDVCTLDHLATRYSDEGVLYTATIETYTWAPFDQVDGQVQNMNGTFISNERPNAVSFDARQAPSFVPLIAPVYAGAIPNRVDGGVGMAIVGAQGGAFSLGAGGITADFALIDLSAGPMLTNIRYGQPLAGNWDTSAWVATQNFYFVPVPGTNRTPGFNVAVSTTIDLDNLGPSPIVVTPRLGPPQSVTIDGVDWLQAQTGISVTPTIAWSAPAVGTPDVIELDVYLLRDLRPAKVLIASLATARSSLTLPPGLLDAGKQYLFDLRASKKKALPSGRPITSAPFHSADITDAANTVSAPVAVAP